MHADSLLPFDLPAVCRTKVTAAFDGGAISPDGGLVLLREAERRIGLSARLAKCMRDRRDPALISHQLTEMLLFRMLAIACGNEDADDCDVLRKDSLFKLAVGRAPESGDPLCSQPTMSRLENMSSKIEAARMTAAMGGLFCHSFPAPPASLTLDIDDSCDPVHGQKQMSTRAPMKRASRSAPPRWQLSTSPATRSILNATIPSAHAASRTRSGYLLESPK